MRTRIATFLRGLQRRMLVLLLATYVIGALLPGPGLVLRAARVALAGGGIVVSPSTLLLGFLLMVGGMGVRLDEARRVFQRPWLALSALVANAAFPILFTVGASVLLRAWHSTDEAQNILVGLALVGAMPIAGASTAWSQNANGNLALSLGLVLGSTLLSPLVTPLGLHAIGGVTQGDYSEDLHELAQTGTTGFILFAVVAPTLLGILLRALLGHDRTHRALPALKAVNLGALLLLNYINSSATLPQVIARPDWDYLALILSLATALCVGAFVLGWLLARPFHADARDQTAVMFGMGMNNNGTGLVLASQALADHPLVLVPMIFYNLVQQIVAAAVDRGRRRLTVSSDPVGAKG